MTNAGVHRCGTQISNSGIDMAKISQHISGACSQARQARQERQERRNPQGSIERALEPLTSVALKPMMIPRSGMTFTRWLSRNRVASVSALLQPRHRFD
jgi:hypothetical protein